MRTSSWIGSAPVLIALACGSTDDSAVTAQDVVTAETSRALVFEVDAVAGYEPSSQALDDVAGELDELRARGVLDKPDGIEMLRDEALAAPAEEDPAWSAEALEALASAHRSVDPGPDALVLHVLYVPGHAEGDTDVQRTLGLAIGHALVVMFRATIDEECDALPRVVRQAVCALAESSVLLHEVGHLMWLVNDGLPMESPHQDVEHGAHDVDEDCIMHYLADRSGYAALLADRAHGGTLPASPFCDACLADLAAAQSPE